MLSKAIYIVLQNSSGNSDEYHNKRQFKLFTSEPKQIHQQHLCECHHSTPTTAASNVKSSITINTCHFLKLCLRYNFCPILVTFPPPLMAQSAPPWLQSRPPSRHLPFLLRQQHLVATPTHSTNRNSQSYGFHRQRKQCSHSWHPLRSSVTTATHQHAPAPVVNWTSYVGFELDVVHWDGRRELVHSAHAQSIATGTSPLFSAMFYLSVITW